MDRPRERTGRTSISAHAAVRVEPGPGGGVRVSELRSEVPLVLRRTGIQAGSATGAGADHPRLPTVTVYLVNAAAGPLAGDRLRLDISVGAGVRLVLRSVAATVALPGHGDGPSLFDVHATVASGGVCEYLPEPTVAARGCHHLMQATVRLAATARLVWREEIVLGRFGEAAGSVSSALRVDVDTAGDPGTRTRTRTSTRTGSNTARMTRPLVRQDLRLGPDAPGLDGPAVLGGARAIGSLLVAGPGPDGLAVSPAVTDVFAVLPLAGPGVLVSALAPDTVTLRRALDAGRAAVPDP
ncbi:urease accessory protein UreD [Frankia sp. Cppng1_Ct_nod]|uniref:urease accessory protein UreD n=1 Tax=Frankia sp. Cppng1_Ct_nod TaxID=2897162 RepID=UPI001041858E|nr:urease accessory protein UreD [Frankia sp. Cppng1_Ct_nod]